VILCKHEEDKAFFSLISLRKAMQISLLTTFHGLVVLSCVLLAHHAVSSSKCDRIPESQSAANKSPADGRYKLRILGDPERYIPGENYTSKRRHHRKVATLSAHAEQAQFCTQQLRR
jgi:hypothetical protein